MSAATVSLPDMGEWNITSQIKIDGQIAPDFSFDWEVVHDGHKYIMPLRKPQGSKENTTLNSVIDITFQHWAIWQLKRWYFFTIQPNEAGVAWPDKYIASVSLNLGDFCTLFRQILNYYYGDKITIALNPDWQYKAEPEVMEISYSHIWDVLIKIYDVYGVRWQIEPNESPDKYVIKVGYPATEQSHIFEYGFEGGLLKVERQVQSEEIANMLLGRGGEKNLPYRYFKDIDPENDTFPADPDWIEELANIYFANLMPATFRSYVQGWKAAHISKYPGYTAVGENNAYAPWAYRKGYTDTKFDPVEYVADEITISPEEGDKQVAISPTYSPYVKKGSSIAKYGPLLNGLDNNEEIYPTIQGVTVDPYGRIDEAVAVEKILSDNIEEASEGEAEISNVGGGDGTAKKVTKNGGTAEIEIMGDTFDIPAGKIGNFDWGVITVSAIIEKTKLKWAAKSGNGGFTVKSETTSSKFEQEELIVIEDITGVAVNESTGETRSLSGIPEGKWRYRLNVTVQNSYEKSDLDITAACESPKVTIAEISEKWTNKWRIWVKNIWQTSKQSGETDAQYAERVWRPILGDREGNEAKVVFASGMLAHEDYEFTITSIPKYEHKLCTWQTVEGGQIVEHEYWSEWCIELGKSDAEIETLGVYLPSVMRQAIAGDFFFFIGIDMPHLYVKWGEERVDNWKKDNLQDKSDIKPTWVVQTDRVRLNNEGKPDALIRQLHPGDTLRLADKRFIEGDYETPYLSSLTISYREPTKDDAALNPDVEIVLSDRYEVSASPVATLQGEVSALAKQVGSISNIEQIVRAVGDKLYLRKDGLPDRSMSPTEFASLLTSTEFRSGIVGGKGWGFFKDENGNWVLETDRIKARQDFEVNNLVINQIISRGGMEVSSAASMEVEKVIDTSAGYVCYFDQRGGSVVNLFHVDDVAYCNRFTPENSELKFYKRRVTAVSVDSITLSKTDVNGAGIPATDDVIVQYGNYTDANRQFVKVRDVIGGGYERYIEGLDSVNAVGTEYYFVGRQTGMYNGRPRWYIGDENGYIEWINGKLYIKGDLSVMSTINNKPIGDVISDAVSDFDTLFIQASSPTIAPTLPTINSSTGEISDLKGWSTTAPEWQNGMYMWQCVYTRYGDGSAEISGLTCISGATGQPGTGITISSQSVRYSTDHGSSQPADSTFTLAAVPTLSAGQYLWSRTEVTYSNGQSTKSYAVSRVGADGADGENGASYTDNLLLNSHFLKSVSNWHFDGHPYAVEDDATMGAVVKWTPPATPVNTRFYQFVTDVWKAGEVYTYSFWAKASGNTPTPILQASRSLADTGELHQITTSWKKYFGTIESTATVSGGSFSITCPTGGEIYITKIKLERGANKDPQWTPAASEMVAPVITSTSVTYAKSVVSTQPADSAFTYASIGAANPAVGEYLWTKTVVNYSDGSNTKSYSVGRIGSDGADGIGTPGADGKTTYVHYAYANSADGQTGFSTTYFAGALYVGVCTDFNQADPTDYTKYEWARLKGEDGTPAKLVVVNADATAFMYKDDFATLVEPQTIQLSANLQGTSGYQWAYKPIGASGFTNFIRDNNGKNRTLNLTPDVALFPDNARTVLIRCTSGDVYDEITIAKVSSGSNGKAGSNYSNNLLLGTRNWEGWTHNSYQLDGEFNGLKVLHCVGPDGSGYYDVKFRGVELKGNTVYTMSVWAKGSGTFHTYLWRGTAGVTARIINIDGVDSTSTASDTKAIHILTSGWKRYFVVFLTKDRTDLQDKEIVACRVLATSEVWVAGAKLEEGDNRETAWTPAPSEMVGTDGQDAYTILLSNESHIFEGDTEKAVAASAESSVIAYKGATQVAAVIGNITGMPAGMSVAVQNNGMASAKFIVSVTPAMTQKQGTLNIPVTVDGKTFTQVFSWTLSLKGSGYANNLLTGTQDWYGWSQGAFAESGEYDGLKVLHNVLVGTQDLSLNGAVDLKPDTVYTLSVMARGTGTFNTYVFPNVSAQMLSVDGAPPTSFIYNDDAVAIHTLTSEWRQFTAIFRTQNRNDLQGKNVIAARVGAGTDIYVAGAKLQEGNDPNPIWSPNSLEMVAPTITEEYYLSTSNTELSGGAWSTQRPEWISGHYYWTRTKIEYATGRTEYTEPICNTGESGSSGENLLRNSAFLEYNNEAESSDQLSRVRLPHWLASNNVFVAEKNYEGDNTILINTSYVEEDSYRGVMQEFYSAPNSEHYLPLKAGDALTASVWVASWELDQIVATNPDRAMWLECRAYAEDGTVVYGGETSLVPDYHGVWQRFSATTILTQDCARFTFRIYHQRKAIAYYAHPKLEMGRHATEWAASPKDVNYLQKALENGGSVEAGLFLGSMITLGYKDTRGFNVMSGMNGIYNSNVAGGGMAYFAGGDPGAALDESKVTYCMRMDGTGFFAGKTIRVWNNLMEVGDYVTLDSDGLKLFEDKAHENIRLAVTNQSVGDEINLFDSADKNYNTFTDLTLTLAGRESNEVILDSVATLPIVIVTNSNQKDYSLGSITANTTLNIAVSVAFGWLFAMNDEGVVGAAMGTLCVDLLKGSEVVESYKGSFNLTSQTTVGASVNINKIVDAGTYSLKIYALPSPVTMGLPTKNKTASGQITGTAKKGFVNKTILGTDGFVTVWGGNTAIMCKEGTALLRAGNFGIRVSVENGIEASKNAGNADSWVKLIN